MTNQKSKITLTQEQIQQITSDYSQKTTPKRGHTQYYTLEQYLDHQQTMFNIYTEQDPQFTFEQFMLDLQNSKSETAIWSAPQKTERFRVTKLTPEQKILLLKQIRTGYYKRNYTELLLSDLQPDNYINLFDSQDEYYPITIISATAYNTNLTTYYTATSQHDKLTRIFTIPQPDPMLNFQIFNFIFELFVTENQ